MDKTKIKDELIEALRWPKDLNGFATDGDSRSDIDRAVGYIAKEVEAARKENNDTIRQLDALREGYYQKGLAEGAQAERELCKSKVCIKCKEALN